ncbi:hypothetical protein [Fretibacter rubidus]|uniref:DUF6958 family protein n=1 Tax=Fretibacter rubidus TaxID=570162 RepID=UPI00352A610D
MIRDEKIEVENINTPGRVTRVNRAKYEAMKMAMLKALPKTAPGLSFKDGVEAVRVYLTDDLFPGGDTAGWWFKCVQLDLEAKGIIKRTLAKPLRWWVR